MALNTSFISSDQAKAFIRTRVDRKTYRLSEIDIYQPMGGYTLGPGQSVHTDLLYIEVSDDPQGSLERYADQVAKYYRTNPGTPAKVGWLGWATAQKWYDPACNENYERMAKRNLKAVKKRLGGLGVDHIWVSQANFHAHIPMQWGKGKLENFVEFPKGFISFCKWLRKNNFKLGLWVMPFRVISTSNLFRQHPGFLLKHPDGTRCREVHKRSDGTFEVGKGEPYRWAIGPSRMLPQEEKPEVWFLDPSHPECNAWIERTMRYLTRETGPVWYMLDFLDGPNVVGAGFHDKDLIPGIQAYREGIKACRRGTGKRVLLNACSTMQLDPLGLIDTARVVRDYVEVPKVAYDWEYNKAVFLQSFCHYFTHRKFYLNESMLVLTVDYPLPIETARYLASVFNFTDSTMWLGDDIGYISEERLALIKKGLPKYPGIGRPLHMFDYDCPSEYPPILVQPVVKDWEQWHCVGLFNFDAETRRIEITAADFGYQASRLLCLFDFWNETLIGTFRKKIVVPVDTRSKHRVVSLRAVKDHPWIIGSNFHFTQGGVELADVVWDKSRKRLSGSVVRPRGNRGRLFILVPEGYAFRTVTVAGAEGRGIMWRPPVLCAEFLMKADRARFTVQF